MAWSSSAPAVNTHYRRWPEAHNGRVGASTFYKSFHLLQQLPRFTQQHPDLLALGDRFPREQSVPARVPVSPRGAGPRRTAVHAAAPLAAHRRRAARSAGAGFCAATAARHHRIDIGRVIAQASAFRSVRDDHAGMLRDEGATSMVGIWEVIASTRPAARDMGGQWNCAMLEMCR